MAESCNSVKKAAIAMQQYDKHDLLQKKNELAAAKKLRK
jgi:hypothetical protein